MHTRLAEAGMAVYGYDHHGHGDSEPRDAGERALVHDFNHLVSTLAKLCSSAQSVACRSRRKSTGLIAPHRDCKICIRRLLPRRQQRGIRTGPETPAFSIHEELQVSQQPSMRWWCQGLSHRTAAARWMTAWRLRGIGDGGTLRASHASPQGSPWGAS